MKFLLFVIFLCLASKALLGRWPWQWTWPTSRSGKLEQARLLLGVGAKAGREEIVEAHRKLVAQVHPDRGGTNELVHEANEARDTLLTEAARHIAE
jgi:hypothetical protein